MQATTQHPKTQKSFRGGVVVLRRDSVEKYIFSDTKNLDENRRFQDPDGSRNPGTKKGSRALGLILYMIKK